MIVLGIHDGKDPCVALLREGSLVRLGFEADFKDDAFEVTGFPITATQELLAIEGLEGSEIDLVAFSGQHLEQPRTRRELLKQYAEYGTFKGLSKRILRTAIPFSSRGAPSRRERIKPLEKLGIKAELKFIDHHLAQAAVAAASVSSKDGKLLVANCTGSGDGISASVHVSRGGRLERVATISEEDSIGSFLETVTFLMGMVPQRDESLLMELGALARGPQITKLTKRLSLLFEFDPSLPLNWRRSGNMPETYNSVEFLRNHLRRRRFDHIAGAARSFLEELLGNWIDRAALKTNCDAVVLTGNVFGLRALYPSLAKTCRASQMSISPVPFDHGNAIGAAIMALSEAKGVEHILPLGHLWQGSDADEASCAKFVREEEAEGGVWIEQPENVEERVASLLSGGALLGRISGRVDVSRRGFGNRSLLCRGDLPELRDAAANLVRPDVFWTEIPALVLEEELSKEFHGTGKIPAGIGEYWLVPKRPFAWTGRMKPRAAMPVFVTNASADPATASLVQEYRKVAGRSPLLCAPWINSRGLLVRDIKDVKESWRHQGLDGVIVGPYILLRKADPDAAQPKHKVLARRPFFGGLS
ncbi:carbamoyltransferase N-terminal domain-containing protein [Planctomycetota bacterium]|nr:carbamoyltransferase N-terminal domain-containing protein [Planctomycetota bacterium]